MSDGETDADDSWRSNLDRRSVFTAILTAIGWVNDITAFVDLFTEKEVEEPDEPEAQTLTAPTAKATAEAVPPHLSQG